MGIGLIIGKQGKNITEIRESSNTKITVSEQIANAVDRVLTVTGDLEGISMAFSLIAAKLIETVAPASKSAAVIKLLVPSSRMGTIIGSKGVKIKEIHETSG
jgi:heterogeneous nuclear rnp K-like protein